MPSPFPGMDPWLESPAIFSDFHTAFLNAVRIALNAVLPPPFYAGVSTRVWLDQSERRVEPDVDVFRPTNGTHPLATGGVGGGVAVAADPATTLLEIVAPTLPEEQIEERFVEIFAAPGGDRLVTSVELLSRSNKTAGSTGRDLYRAKQREMDAAGVNLVEIDLLRAGSHATLVPPDLLRERAGPFDYHVCVRRADRPGSYFVAPVRLPDRLPSIPIPLSSEVPPVVIALQAAFDRCYDEALYARRVRYDRACDPPLAPERTAWATELLKSKGLA